MKVDCIIDGKALSLSVSSHKPLSLILSEDLENPSINSMCGGKACGNCVVLFNEEATLSCLIPAFRIRNATIRTFESYRRSRQYRDIERAYKASGNTPCQLCYNARTLIIESILQELSIETKSHRSDEEAMREMIIRELSLNTCQCIDMAELVQIVEIALTYRNRRSRVSRS
ncbi:MAG TPA: ferredoxin [Sphaerochaeta sp.]|nr:ferredoxin [Sphaerochaeta sp.]